MTTIDLNSTGVDLTQLRNYQIQGVEWLLKNNKGILADDMGLGKTLQVIKSIQILLEIKEIQKVLVACPISLIKNWEEELSKWSPEIKFKRVTSDSSNIEVLKALDSSDVIITNYENIRSKGKFRPKSIS